MAVKLTIQGLLIYAAMATYLAAAVADAFGKSGLTDRRRLGSISYTLGFLLAAAAFTYRWFAAGHIPLQTMFEVFLAMGVVIYPITFLCRRLGARAESVDMLLGFIVLFPAGFIFTADPQRLPPALQSPLFGPHVAVYLLGYIIMAKAAASAIFLFLPEDFQPAVGEQQMDDNLNSHLASDDLVLYRLVCLGFPLLTFGLLLGSWWGKLAWGDYWGWDPKEMWSLASWLVYVLYFHLRCMHGPRYPRLRAAVVLLGFAAIVVTILWVNLSRIFPSIHSYAS
jgi:cytochrome c-type biogenesis protein CcsB